MNTGLTLLWGLVVIGVIIIIILAILGMVQWTGQRSVVIPENEGKCAPPFDQLEDISNLPCCRIGATRTAFRYVPEFNLVVSPTPIYYPDACQGFCTNGLTTEGDILRCVGGAGQANYDSCITLTQPKNCRGISYPIAAIGTQYFYAYSATNAACQSATSCT